MIMVGVYLSGSPARSCCSEHVQEQLCQPGPTPSVVGSGQHSDVDVGKNGQVELEPITRSKAHDGRRGKIELEPPGGGLEPHDADAALDARNFGGQSSHDERPLRCPVTPDQGGIGMPQDGDVDDDPVTLPKTGRVGHGIERQATGIAPEHQYAAVSVDPAHHCVELAAEDEGGPRRAGLGGGRWLRRLRDSRARSDHAERRGQRLNEKGG
jgi:hypothetical protein